MNTKMHCFCHISGVSQATDWDRSQYLAATEVHWQKRADCNNIIPGWLVVNEFYN